jgi:hypothetical protein
VTGPEEAGLYAALTTVVGTVLAGLVRDYRPTTTRAEHAYEQTVQARCAAAAEQAEIQLRLDATASGLIPEGDQP